MIAESVVPPTSSISLRLTYSRSRSIGCTEPLCAIAITIGQERVRVLLEVGQSRRRHPQMADPTLARVRVQGPGQPRIIGTLGGGAEPRDRLGVGVDPCRAPTVVVDGAHRLPLAALIGTDEIRGGRRGGGDETEQPAHEASFAVIPGYARWWAMSGGLSTLGGMKITVLEGDITEVAVDAIVNAANSSLLGGGGVDGAIHRAAGPALLEACREVRRTTHVRGLPPGHAVATSAGDLPARWVIHTVGPNRHAGEADPEVLESCFESSLNLAEEVGATSIAFPAIGGGVYGWSARDVAEAAHSVIVDGRSRGRWESIEEVQFVLFNDQMTSVFCQIFDHDQW
jgi:O-acetyl-ADP-ribose deacetylase (regulator of RNase III)